MSKQEKILKISMEKEVNRNTEALEREIASDETLRDVKVTQEMDQRMAERIRAYEAEKRKEEGHEADMPAGQTGKYKRKAFFYRPKLWVALTAVLILVLSMGITTIGEKSFWKNWWGTMWGGDKVSFVDVKEMDAIESEDEDETTVYVQINDALNINIVRLDNLPEKMRFHSYTVDEDQRLAKIYYKYNGETIRYNIYLNGRDASYGTTDEDEQTDVFEVESSKQKVRVEEYEVPDKSVHRYIAHFEYGGTHYELKGIMERSEIEQIIKKLKYL